MHLIFCLMSILTDFRPLFNRQSFDLFCTFILGLITHRHRATITGTYLKNRRRGILPRPQRVHRNCTPFLYEPLHFVPI